MTHALLLVIDTDEDYNHWPIQYQNLLQEQHSRRYIVGELEQVQL